MSNPTVFIVDDDASVRDSLSALLESAGMKTTAYPSAQSFLDSYDSSSGCLLLDVKMPLMSGLELQARLAQEGIQIPVIIMTGHGDIKMAVSAMKAGAIDFIEKPFNDEDLIQSINNALELDKDHRQKEISAEQTKRQIATLTKREHEVLEHVVRGDSSKAIGRKLGISPRTVEIHRSKIMQKLNAKNLSHLVRIALVTGILSG